MNAIIGPSQRHLVALIIAVSLLTNIAMTGKTHAQDADSTSNKALFANFLHNAVLGKFDRADSYAKKLLSNNPDPMEILDYSDSYTNSLKTLYLLVNNVQLSQSAQQILQLIEEGELLKRKDPERIKANIEKLGGDPQTEFNAIGRLTDSGEYAVPWLIRALQDDSRSRLHNRVLRMFPKMGKQAVNPLVVALSMDDNQTKIYVARTLGAIGYPQAVPYLMAAAAVPSATDELKAAAMAALQEIYERSSQVAAQQSADQSFLELARQYYSDHGSVKADPRQDFANVWYWENGELNRIEVTREIFNEIMAMRCSEETLRLNPNADEAVAIWLASNFRREAELGLDVESPEPIDASATDPTKKADFPRSTYFARASGAKYCHMVLDLGISNREPAVALGAISALRLIAGATNLTGTEDYKQPLAQALVFPDLAVRLKAGLALARALPSQPFAGADRVVPILSEALAQTGGSYVLVVEPDEQNRNRVMNALRSDDSTVIGGADLYDGLSRARAELPTLSAIFLSSEVGEPGLVSAMEALRGNAEYEITPVVLLTRQAHIDLADQITQADPATVSVTSVADDQALRNGWQGVARRTGQSVIDADSALTLALDAAESLRDIAFSRSVAYDFNLAEPALIGALHSSEQILQTTAASVLALSAHSTAQQAIAQLALDANRSESLRVAVFDSLAESAKNNGNLLTEDLTDRLIDMAINEPNLILRSAASQALGAMNVPSSKASQIIEPFYRG